MDRRDFAAWCKAATEKIRYGPDRDMVSKELRDHLEDRFDALVAQGVPEEEAARQSLEAMGSAETIAPQLAAIHRPWLGWLVTAVEIAAILSVIITALSVPPVMISYFTAVLNGNIYVESHENQISSTYDIHLSQNVEGYDVVIDQVKLSEQADRLYFQLWVRWFPGMPRFLADDYFYAVDSNGNIYASMDSRTQLFDRKAGRWISSGGGSSGSCYFRNSLSLTEFDTTAQWVELRYDRDGREIALRIDLTGGEPVG